MDEAMINLLIIMSPAIIGLVIIAVAIVGIVSGGDE